MRTIKSLDSNHSPIVLNTQERKKNISIIGAKLLCL